MEQVVRLGTLQLIKDSKVGESILPSNSPFKNLNYIEEYNI